MKYEENKDFKLIKAKYNKILTKENENMERLKEYFMVLLDEEEEEKEENIEYTEKAKQMFTNRTSSRKLI